MKARARVFFTSLFSNNPHKILRKSVGDVRRAPIYRIIKTRARLFLPSISRVSKRHVTRLVGARARAPAHSLTQIVLGEIELRAELLQTAHGLVVVQRDGLDAAEDDVLGDLDAESAEAGHEHVRGRHATHGVVPEDVELPRVEALVDLGGRPAGAARGSGAAGAAAAAPAAAIGAGVGARRPVLRHVYVYLRHVRRCRLVVGSSRRAGSTNASLLGWGINGALHHLSTRHRRTSRTVTETVTDYVPSIVSPDYAHSFPLSLSPSHPSPHNLSLPLSLDSFLSPRPRARARALRPTRTHGSPDDLANAVRFRTLDTDGNDDTISTRSLVDVGNHGRTRTDQPRSLSPPSPLPTTPLLRPAPSAASAARDRSSGPFGDDRLCPSPSLSATTRSSVSTTPMPPYV